LPGVYFKCILAGMSAILEARDVVRSFGQTPALRGASIAVEQGELVREVVVRDGKVSTLTGHSHDPPRTCGCS